LTLAYGCRTGPPAYVAWRATTLCRSHHYPPSQGLWIWLLDSWILTAKTTLIVVFACYYWKPST